MTAAPAPALVDSTTDDGDELVHTWCCDQDRALCGKSLAGHEFICDPPPEDECVVCLGLISEACCPTCDRRFGIS